MWLTTARIDDCMYEFMYESMYLCIMYVCMYACNHKLQQVITYDIATYKQQISLPEARKSHPKLTSWIIYFIIQHITDTTLTGTNNIHKGNHSRQKIREMSKSEVTFGA